MSVSELSDTHNDLEASQNLSESTLNHEMSEAQLLKQTLYNSLKQKGLINDIKTQIRHRLIAEITSRGKLAADKNKIGTQNDETTSHKITHGDISIANKLALSLIQKHLVTRHFDYTLSVLCTETGLDLNHGAYSNQEILRLLRVQPECKLHKSLTKVLDSDGARVGGDFLTVFLQTICENLGEPRQPQKEMMCQTENSLLPPTTQLSDKIQKIDREFDKRLCLSENRATDAFETRLAAYQKELDKRHRVQLEHEIERFKKNELQTMAQHQRDEYRAELDKVRKRLESEYRARVTELSRREKEQEESVEQRSSEQQRQLYLERQNLLENMSRVQERELAVKRNQEHWEAQHAKIKEHHQNVEKDLAVRQSRLRDTELDFERKLMEEANKIKLNEETKYVTKWKELELTDVRLTEEKNQIEKRKAAIDKRTTELQERQSLLNEMEIISYPKLKESAQNLEKQLETLKENLQNSETEHNNDRQKLANLLKEKSEPSVEHVLLNTELTRAREMLQREQRVWHEQRGQLETRLADKHRDLQTQTDRVRDLEEKNSELATELRDLTEQLDHAQRALATRLQPQPNQTGAGSLTARSYMIDDATITEMSGEGGKSARISLRTVGHRLEDASTADTDPLFAETRNRLENLHNESNQLMQAYENYRTRLINEPPPAMMQQSSDDVSPVKTNELLTALLKSRPSGPFQEEYRRRVNKQHEQSSLMATPHATNNTNNKNFRRHPQNYSIAKYDVDEQNANNADNADDDEEDEEEDEVIACARIGTTGGAHHSGQHGGTAVFPSSLSVAAAGYTGGSMMDEESSEQAPHRHHQHHQHHNLEYEQHEQQHQPGDSVQHGNNGDSEQRHLSGPRRNESPQRLAPVNWQANHSDLHQEQAVQQQQLQHPQLHYKQQNQHYIAATGGGGGGGTTEATSKDLGDTSYQLGPTDVRMGEMTTSTAAISQTAGGGGGAAGRATGSQSPGKQQHNMRVAGRLGQTNSLVDDNPAGDGEFQFHNNDVMSEGDETSHMMRSEEVEQEIDDERKRKEASQKKDDTAADELDDDEDEAESSLEIDPVMRSFMKTVKENHLQKSSPNDSRLKRSSGEAKLYELNAAASTRNANFTSVAGEEFEDEAEEELHFDHPESQRQSSRQEKKSVQQDKHDDTEQQEKSESDSFW